MIGITEKDHVHDRWYEEAKAVRLDTLPEFLRHLTEDYSHDYGTICHAVAAAAVAAAWAMNSAPCGGITGFQASAVMWEFIAHWESQYKGKPLRLCDYSNMLYPQYGHTFANTISRSTWEYLQAEARERLAESVDAAPHVAAHWESIVAGIVPFGYAVEES